MKKADFIKGFTKTEILEVLFGNREFKQIADRMCNTLFERKSNQLLDKMDRLANIKLENCKDAQDFWKRQKEFEQTDKALEKLSKDFDSLEW